MPESDTTYRTGSPAYGQSRATPGGWVGAKRLPTQMPHNPKGGKGSQPERWRDRGSFGAKAADKNPMSRLSGLTLNRRW